MQVLINSLHKDYLCYIFVNVLTVIINKFVLSVLKFTIPTVFQGWQTFVCVIILSLLAHLQKLGSEVEVYDKKTFLKLLLPLLCFTIGIVAGSKALAELPIPLFLAGGNTIPATIILLELSKKQHGSGKLTESVLIYGTVAFLFVLTVTSSSIYGWLWLGVHVAASVLQSIAHSSPLVPKISAISLIYYRNFFSIIILIPLSVYLEEATLAYDYHHNLADIKFYIGCILSGVMGTWLQFLNNHFEDFKFLPVFLSFSKILASLASFYVLETDLELHCWVLVIFNQLSCIFGFTFDYHFATGIPEKTVVHV